MSRKHPIVAVTGSSGAGTTTVKTTFEWIFRRDKIDAAIVEGDAFQRLERLLIGKTVNGGPKKLAKGTKISKEYLDDLDVS